MLTMEVACDFQFVRGVNCTPSNSGVKIKYPDLPSPLGHPHIGLGTTIRTDRAGG